MPADFSTSSERPHILIVGGGFAGLQCAKGLATVAANITLFDRHNYHLFQPLLYQVATAVLSPADIAAPIRKILRKQQNV
ncbi:MAG: FAD-dependent oxidoreductase, partial [Desulfuromusa sp.]